ncbi:MAG: hypothetical protein ACKO0Z_25270 [Betaproteobacteria bacterium]
MLNAVASTVFHALVVMCHPTFENHDGIKVGTSNYCIISMPVDFKYDNREACEAKLKEFTKYEGMEDLEKVAMGPGGTYVGVCHESAEALPLERPVEGFGSRKQIVNLYGPKGDGV